MNQTNGQRHYIGGTSAKVNAVCLKSEGSLWTPDRSAYGTFTGYIWHKTKGEMTQRRQKRVNRDQGISVCNHAVTIRGQQKWGRTDKKLIVTYHANCRFLNLCRLCVISPFVLCQIYPVNVPYALRSGVHWLPSLFKHSALTFADVPLM